jgi:hypothetical protein
MNETLKLGYKYVADSDSRSIASAHPDGNLWDNGADAIAELQHLMRLRAQALAGMSEANIREGRPLATLEEVLVPIYLLHRFQIQAVGKLIGGSYFDYALRGDGQNTITAVAADRQREAIDALFATLDPAVLRLPPELLASIPPRPPGHPKSRETFSGSTGVVFDELAPARSAVSMTLDVLLNPVRAARMTRSGAPGFAEVTNRLLALAWLDESDDAALQRLSGDLLLTKLMQLAVNPAVDAEVRSTALAAINQLYDWLIAAEAAPTGAAPTGVQPQHALARLQIERMRDDPASVAAIVPVASPPGGPIGMPGATGE